MRTRSSSARRLEAPSGVTPVGVSSKVEQSGRHKTMMMFNWMEIIIIMLSPQVCIYWSELKHRIGCSYQLPLTP